jgi:PAS domain S-box-containing protein
MKLSTIIIFAFIFVGLVGTLFGTSLLYFNSENLIEGHVINKLNSTAQSRVAHIETYLQQNIERLELITSKTQLKIELEKYIQDENQASLDNMAKIIKDSLEPVPDFERICVVGNDGVVITSTDDSFCGKDIHNEEFFIHGKETEAIHFVEEDGELKLFVTGPFKVNDKPIGIGVTVVKINRLEDIVKLRAGLGESGEVLIAINDHETGERIYLFDRLFEQEAISQQIESEETAFPMEQALEKKEELFENSLDYRNEPVIAISQYIETAEMGLVAKIDSAEALGEAKKDLLQTSLIVGLFMILFTFFSGFLIARYISKPIKKMTLDVSEITKGKLDIQLGKSKISEIQGLTDSLNRILASLKLAILKTGTSKEKLRLREAIKAKDKAEVDKKMAEKYAEIIVNQKGDLVDINPAAISMLGYNDKEEVMKKNKSSIDLIIPAEKKKVIKGIQDTFKTGSNEAIYHVLKKDGSQITVDLIAKSAKDKEGKIISIVTVRDITGKSKINKKLEETNPIKKPALKTEPVKKLQPIVKKPAVVALKKIIPVEKKPQDKSENIDKKIINKDINKK